MPMIMADWAIISSLPMAQETSELAGSGQTFSRAILAGVVRPEAEGPPDPRD
jgi:hypothetical protein